MTRGIECGERGYGDESGECGFRGEWNGGVGCGSNRVKLRLMVEMRVIVGVVNVEKEDMEMKVDIVKFVENEMVELNVVQIGLNWGWMWRWEWVW